MESNFGHNDSSMNLGYYNDMAFITGGQGKATESMVYRNGALKWNLEEDLPIEGDLLHFSMVSYDNKILAFGDHGPDGIVLEFARGSWKNLGNLKSIRVGHQSIKVGNEVLIVGGTSEESDVNIVPILSEVWNIRAHTSIQRQPLLSAYFFPPLFIVKSEFCAK